MAGGLLGDLFGTGATDANALDLNRLVRPPDPLGAALAAMSERFATAGQASRVPVSTLGAIGSALGGAGAAANTAQTQYLDQAVKLQALKRSLIQQGYDEKTAQYMAQVWANETARLKGSAAPSAVTPGAPAAVPGAPAAPGAGGPFALPNVPDYSGAFGPAATPSPGIGGGDQGARARMQLTSLLGASDGGLLADPGGTIDPRTGGDLLLQGGPAAGVTQASFRSGEAAPVVAAANGPANGLDPAMLRGLLAGGDNTGLAAAGEGLLGGAGAPGPPDELIRGPTADLPIRQASMQAPRSEAEIIRSESGGKPYVGYGGVDLTNAPRDQYGFPIWEGRMGPAGISHAAGIYQFQPGTWREGAAALGIKDFSPESQKAVYDWTRDKYGDAPWRASEGGGARPSVMLAQYAPGGGGGGAPPLVGGQGIIPGLGMTPTQAAVLDTMSKLAGHTTSPFKDLLDLYYKSPEYLQQSAGAQARGRLAEEEPSQQRMKYLDLMIDMRKNGMFIDPQTGQVKSDPAYDQIVNRREEDKQRIASDYQKQLKTYEEQITIETEKRKDQRETVTAPVYGKDGQVGEETMTRAEQIRRLQNQGMRKGGDYQSGDIVVTPLGKPPSGYGYQISPQGGVTAQAVPGTPEAQEVADKARAKAQTDFQMRQARDIVDQDVARAEHLVKNSTLPVVGLYGSKLTGLYPPANDLAQLIQTLKSRASLDSINQTRAATGSSGLGQITEGEHRLLAAQVANLEQSQSEAQFLQNLARFKEAYARALTSPGNPTPAAGAPPVLSAPAPGTGGRNLGRFNRQTGQFEPVSP